MMTGLMKNGKEFELIFDNSLDDYEKLSLSNLERLDYKKEKNLKKSNDEKADIEIEDCDILEEEIELNLEEIYQKDVTSDSKEPTPISDEDDSEGDESSDSDNSSSYHRF